MSTPVDVVDYAAQAEELSDEIEALDNTRAPLWAVYGYNGTWDAERKALLCACANRVRANAAGKITEAAIDHAAHADTDYSNRIVLAEQQRTQMALLDAEIASKTRRFELLKERMANVRKIAGLQ